VLAELIERLLPVDLVLVEGFRDDDIPKIEVFRPQLGQAPFWPRMRLLAVATDAALPDCPLAVLDLNAPERIADFIGAALQLNDCRPVKE
jgi:molybdopterin-guanine dinucleotide biosynthesis protein B